MRAKIASGIGREIKSNSPELCVGQKSENKIRLKSSKKEASKKEGRFKTRNTCEKNRDQAGESTRKGRRDVAQRYQIT